MKSKKLKPPKKTNGVEFMTSAELAARWDMNEGSLRMMRVAGKGPRYVLLGTGPRPRVRYRLDEVQAYERDHGGKS